MLLERLDGLAIIYRLASAMAGVARPLRFRWYRALPMDAAVGLPGGRVIALVRQGAATGQGRLRQAPLAGSGSGTGR